MARAILHQLSLHDDTLIVYLFEVATTRGEPTLRTNKLAHEVLGVCLKATGIVYAIIDGIDECQQTEQKHIAEFWISHVENNGYSCHCVLFSQDDASTRALFSRLPSIQVQGNHHNNDVQSFCSIGAQKIRDKFGLSQHETDIIASQTWLQARSMFLFARVVMENLLDQFSTADLWAEMRPGCFPQELNEA